MNTPQKSPQSHMPEVISPQVGEQAELAEGVKGSIRKKMMRLFRCHKRRDQAADMIMKQVERVESGAAAGIQGIELDQAALLTALAIEQAAREVMEEEKFLTPNSVIEKLTSAIRKRLKDNRLPKQGIDEDEMEDFAYRVAIGLSI